MEQLNPAGLSYRYQYEQDRITVTDSLNRREVLHTEGGAGLKRVVKKELADGSVTHSGYDAAGRLTAQTDEMCIRDSNTTDEKMTNLFAG